MKKSERTGNQNSERAMMNWMLSVRAWSFNGTNGTTASLIFVPDVPVPDHFLLSSAIEKERNFHT